MPKPFDSKKLMTTLLILISIVVVTLTGHADKEVLGAITATGTTQLGLQSLLDLKGKK